MNIWLISLFASTYLIGALLTFNIFLIFWSAWIEYRRLHDLYSSFGFLLFALSFALFSVGFSNDALVNIGEIVRVLGLLLIFYGLWSRPLPNKKSGGSTLRSVVPLAAPLLLSASASLSTIITLMVYAIYKRGKSKEYRYMILAFACITISLLTNALASTTKAGVLELPAVYGPQYFFVIQLIALIAGLWFLFKWTMTYTRLEIFTQLVFTILGFGTILALLIPIVITLVVLIPLEGEVLNDIVTETILLRMYIVTNVVVGIGVIPAYLVARKVLSRINS